MTQLDLFTNPPPPPHVNQPSSRAAAEEIEGSADTLRAHVFAYIKAVGGCTDEECQLALGMNPSTQRPRRVELVQRKLIVDSGETRKTASGRAAIVWRAAK